MKPTHFIVETVDGFLTTRRNVGIMYVNRVGNTPKLDDCRVFNTKAAATNSARQAGYDDDSFAVVGFSLGQVILVENLKFK